MIAHVGLCSPHERPRRRAPAVATTDSGEPDEESLRKQLGEIESEHRDLVAGTMGLISIGNAELAENAKELRREADALRARLGEPRRNPPEPMGRRSFTGWLILIGAVAGLAVLLLLLPR